MSVQIRELSDTELNMVSGGGHPPIVNVDLYPTPQHFSFGDCGAVGFTQDTPSDTVFSDSGPCPSCPPPTIPGLWPGYL
jgi:hypothetical protein